MNQTVTAAPIRPRLFPPAIKAYAGARGITPEEAEAELLANIEGEDVGEEMEDADEGDAGGYVDDGKGESEVVGPENEHDKHGGWR